MGLDNLNRLNELIGCQLINLNLDNGEIIAQKDNKQYVFDFTYLNFPSYELEEMNIFSKNPFIAGIDIERGDYMANKMVITFKGPCKPYSVFPVHGQLLGASTATVTIWFYSLQVKKK